MDFKKIVEDYRTTYHTFEKYEGRKWNAEANLLELYKQVGEMINTKESNIEQFKDEVLDTLCQIIRLMDYYNYDVYYSYEKALSISIDDNSELLLKIVENLGILSKYIMTKEKYYFKTRVNEPKYFITDEKLMECFSNHIAYLLKLAKLKNIDLNEVSNNSREIDKKYFKIIEQNENNITC